MICGYSIYFFLNSSNLICWGMDISKYFRESLALQGNESQLWVDNWALHLENITYSMCKHWRPRSACTCAQWSGSLSNQWQSQNTIILCTSRENLEKKNKKKKNTHWFYMYFINRDCCWKRESVPVIKKENIFFLIGWPLYCKYMDFFLHICVMCLEHFEHYDYAIGTQCHVVV